MIETSLMVDDYPTAPEYETRKVTIVAYVKLTYEDVELYDNETAEDYIRENGILDYTDYEVEDLEEQ